MLFSPITTLNCYFILIIIISSNFYLCNYKFRVLEIMYTTIIEKKSIRTITSLFPCSTFCLLPFLCQYLSTDCFVINPLKLFIKLVIHIRGEIALITRLLKYGKSLLLIICSFIHQVLFLSFFL